MKKTDKPNFRKWGDGMRLIDADALIETIRKYGVYGSGFDDAERVNDVIDTIESQPTIEAVPVVHGEWIGDACSACNMRWNENMVDNADDWGYFDPMPDFCPNCGADMRKKV